MRCLSCQADNRPHAQFCEECEAALPWLEPAYAAACRMGNKTRQCMTKVYETHVHSMRGTSRRPFALSGNPLTARSPS